MIKTVIEIPIRLPGLNEYTKSNRANKYAGAELKRKTEAIITQYIKMQCKAKLGRVKVHFDWREPNAKRDPDNIRFAAKFILDALVACEVIPNDSQRYIAGLSDTFSVSKQPGVRVELEEV